MAEQESLTTPALDEEAMCHLAEGLAEVMRPPLVIYLRGDLGAGKTTFVRALLRKMGHTGRVKSPTYGLLEHYWLPGMSVLHLDLYRIEQPQELDFLGISDLSDASTLLLIEWPERGAGVLPEADFTILFEHEGQARRLTFSAAPQVSPTLLTSVYNCLNTLSS